MFSCLSAVGIRYEQVPTRMFDPIISAYTYKENIECMPTNGCIYCNSGENSFDENVVANDFFQNFSIDSIEAAMHQSFDVECNILLHEFFKTKLYEEAKKNVDQFITTMLSNYHSKLDKTQLLNLEHDKDYKWCYLHDENNEVIGVAGTIKKTFNLPLTTKLTKQEEVMQVVVNGCLSFPLLKIIGHRMCGLKNINFGQEYCLFAKTYEPNKLVPAANIITVDVIIQELPRMQWLVSCVNTKTPNDFVALKAELFLGEKVSLIEEKCHLNNKQYYLASRESDKEARIQLTETNIAIETSATPPNISYSLLHSKRNDCVVVVDSMGGITEHNRFIQLERIKDTLECLRTE